MGNINLGSDVWILDTAATIKAKGISVFVERMVWYPNATDNDLKVTDGCGNVIWEVRAVVPAPNKEGIGVLEAERYHWYDGFILEIIDGGTVNVHIA